MSFFNKDKLIKVGINRGYYNERAICDGLASVFGMTNKKVKNRLNSGKLTKEECEVIGSYFEMTMKEYYDVFMNGLFKIDGAGNYICHIDNLKEHMNPPEPEEPKKKPRTKKQTKEDIIAEIEKI